MLVRKICFSPFTKCLPHAIILPVDGALAQLVAHHTGSVGVSGSNPLCSTEPGSLDDQGFRVFAKERQRYSKVLYQDTFAQHTRKRRPRRVQGRSESPWRAPQSAERGAARAPLHEIKAVSLLMRSFRRGAAYCAPLCERYHFAVPNRRSERHFCYARRRYAPAGAPKAFRSPFGNLRSRPVNDSLCRL